MPHYRHKQIARFVVGRFAFSNHLVTIDEEDREEFLKEVAGLLEVDSNNIVEVMNIQNERPVGPQAIRGELGTNQINDPIRGTAIRASDIKAQQNAAELASREAALAAKEAEFAEKQKLLDSLLAAQPANVPTGGDSTLLNKEDKPAIPPVAPITSEAGQQEAAETESKDEPKPTEQSPAVKTLLGGLKIG